MGDNTYLVVGAGVFGASTALELVRAGRKVIVIDRSADGYAAPDAASNDLNKIVRADYSDGHYRDLGKKAISMWRRSELLRPYYHEVGVFFHTGPDGGGGAGPSSEAQASKLAYVENAVASAAIDAEKEQTFDGQSMKPVAHMINTRDQVHRCFPTTAQPYLGRIADDVSRGNSVAYFNPRGGWAEADRATRAVLDEAKRYGAEVVSEAHVVQLLFDANSGTKVVGVRCADGRTFRTSGSGQVALCVGAWAEELLPSLLGQKLSKMSSVIPTWSSAQCVVTVQLTREQQKMLASAPVVLEFASGFYLFEPDERGLMKIAIHSSGYRSPLPSTDTCAPSAFPTFSSTAAAPSGASRPTPAQMVKEEHIPSDQTRRMLEHLRYVYPQLADAPVVYERVCFYSESLDENWIIANDLPGGLTNLVLASGDSGHAFKFLPLLGSLVCARMGIQQASTLNPHQQRVFSYAHHAAVHRQSVQSQRESSNFKARL